MMAIRSALRPFAGAATKRAGAASLSRSMSSVTIDLKGTFEGHRLVGAPAETVEVTKDELVSYLKLMYTMRRMEITCDTEYKARNIRGFCHLYDGQEAVAVGVNSALDIKDSWITSYRCHCVALCRGSTVDQVIAELFGFKEGVAHGKGGSMHMYDKEHNFYGGQGIVGAQVPVGTGLAFANKYYTPPGEKMPVAIAMFGDGASNQGQVWESANMAGLWKLPMIFCVENNQYGMGTSISRSTANTKYYTMGNNIPGLRMDGMNVLSVREGMKYVKDYVSSGNGPMFVEMNTYRYHGHSMSDPGTTYRNRDEIVQTRSTRDPIEWVKKQLIDNNLLSADDVKEIEKTIRNEVQEALKKAKAGSIPPLDDLFTDIYVDDKGNPTFPPYIRMPDRAKSRTFA